MVSVAGALASITMFRYEGAVEESFDAEVLSASVGPTMKLSGRAMLDSRDQARWLPHHRPARPRPREALHAQRLRLHRSFPAGHSGDPKTAGPLLPDRRRGHRL